MEQNIYCTGNTCLLTRNWSQLLDGCLEKALNSYPLLRVGEKILAYKDGDSIALENVYLELDTEIPLKPLEVRKIGRFLEIKGVAFAAGTWRGIDRHTVEYSKEITKKYYHTIVGARLKGSYKERNTHKPDQDLVIGFVASASYDDRTGLVYIVAYIFDPVAIEYYSQLERFGFSIEAQVFVTANGKDDKGNDKFKAQRFKIRRLSLVNDPACRTCWADPTSVRIINQITLNGSEPLLKSGKNMPFGPYKDIKDCVRKQKKKVDDPKAYCAEIQRKVEEHHSLEPLLLFFTPRFAKLPTEKRKKLPKSDFVFPKEKRYPIHDLAHARNALARVSQHGTPAEKAAVRSAVCKRYPEIESCKKKEEQHSNPMEDMQMEDLTKTLEEKFDKILESIDKKLESNLSTVSEIVAKKFEDVELAKLESKLEKVDKPTYWDKFTFGEKKKFLEDAIQLKERAPVLNPEVALEARRKEEQGVETKVLLKDWGKNKIEDVVAMLYNAEPIGDSDDDYYDIDLGELMLGGIKHE